MGSYLRMFTGLSHLNALACFCPIYLRSKVPMLPTHWGMLRVIQMRGGPDAACLGLCLDASFFLAFGRDCPHPGEIAPAAQPHSRVKALVSQTTDSCSKHRAIPTSTQRSLGDLS